MLNELLVVERGARRAGIMMTEKHPDIKTAGGKSTLIVQLDNKGYVARVQPLPTGVTPWTLRDGQQNSFPFVQLSQPLWTGGDGNEWREAVLEGKKDERRKELLSLAGKVQYFAEIWPAEGFLARLRQRGRQLNGAKGTEASVVRTAIARFLKSCFRKPDGYRSQLLRDVTSAIIKNLEQTSQDDWLKVAVALLIGRREKDKWKCDGALLFEAAGFPLSIADRRLIEPLSAALRNYTSDEKKDQVFGICRLTGRPSRILTGNFPQPNLPAGLGQTYLFAKNKEIPSNDRYGRFSIDAMPVGMETAISLDAALGALTSEDRKNKTWRAIPSETPKQNDLLLAFVDEAIDIPTVSLFTENNEKEDFSEEVKDSLIDAANSVAAFEKRTERIIKAMQAQVSGDWRSTPVHLIIIRRIDKANRKVVYAGAPVVGDVYDAATAWTAGERNIPQWLSLSVIIKGDLDPRPVKPPHLAPLGLTGFSKQIFFRNGKRPPGKKKEQMGLPAAETLKLFFDGARVRRRSLRQRAERILRLVLARRTMLISEFVHAQRRGWDLSGVYDYYEALRTISILGLLLHKLNRNKESYMNDTAFRLGQLLAAADAVHAGYCADVRGGATPPSLLGNQFFVMAQTSPVKALSALARRWSRTTVGRRRTPTIPYQISSETIKGKLRNDQSSRRVRRERNLTIIWLFLRRFGRVEGLPKSPRC